MIRNVIAIVAFALVLSLTDHVPAWSSPLLDSAKQDFQAKRFHAAADSLNKVLQTEPANPEGYYWLGRALEELKDRDGARTMYMSAFKLNPFGPLASLAKTALMNLATREAQLNHPTDGPEVMSQTLQLIERQSADWKRMKVSEGNMWSNWKSTSGAIQINKMGYQATPNYMPAVALPLGSTAPIQSIAEIRAQARSGNAGGNPYLNPLNPYANAANQNNNNWGGYPYQAAGNTYYQPMAGAAGMPPGVGTAFGAPGGFNQIRLYNRSPVSNLNQINTSWIRSDSMVQSMHAQQQGVHSAAELQKSANNLEALLSEKPRAGSPHLRALGTNLFVRNYADHDDDSTPPVDPPLELKAKQETLAEAEKSENKGAHAKALKLWP